MLRLVFAFALATLTSFAMSSDDPHPDRDNRLRPLSPNLREIREEALQGKSSREAFRRHAAHAMRGDNLQIIMGLTEITPEIEQAITAAGLVIVGRHERGELRAYTLQCGDPSQLDALLDLPGVRGIREEPIARRRVGLTTAQSDVSINADDVRANLGTSGQGVRIGILSDSFSDSRGGILFNGYLTGNDDQMTDDLPDAIRMIEEGPSTDPFLIDEGNGMAQIVHDLAPSAEISFATAFSGYHEFADNITALHNDGETSVDIICDDVIYFSEPMYQDGPIALAYDGAFADGVIGFSSAGNEGSRGHERLYQDFNPGSDSEQDPPSGVDLHDFGTASGMAPDTHLTLNLPGVVSFITVTLHWNEPYGGTMAAGPGSETDLNVYILDSTDPPFDDGENTNIVSSSTFTQGTVGDPFGDAYEEIFTVVGRGTYHVVIDHLAGREEGLMLHIEVLLDGTNASIVDTAYLGDRTLYGHAAAAGCVATAAMFYAEIDFNGNLDPPSGQLDVEPFSSLGGNLPFYFDANGQPLPAVETRFKPEITAPDGVNTTFFGGSDVESDGFPNFFGTSAASPNAAAVAALVLSRARMDGQDLSPTQILDILSATAIDAETPGMDFLSGFGLIDAFAAVSSLAPPPDLATIIDDLLLRGTDGSTNVDVNGDGQENAADAVYRVNNP